jgi:hypothetical protein
MLNTIVNSLSGQPELMLGAVLGTLGIVCGCAVGATAIVSEAWRKVRQSEDLNALKQSMLDRGMSADEIATVVNAGHKKRSSVAIGRGGFRACG